MTARDVRAPLASPDRPPDLPTAARLEASEVLRRVGTPSQGLAPEEAARRLATGGPNAIQGHAVRPLAILLRQLKSPLLLLLVVGAAASFAFGERASAVTSSPPAVILQPTRRHLPLLRGLLSRSGTAGNLVGNAHLAALALEHGATVVSFDRDFGRFEGVDCQQPG